MGAVPARRTAAPTPVGEPARRELVCGRCGYGVVVASAPGRCPMCGRAAWRELHRARRGV